MTSEIQQKTLLAPKALVYGEPFVDWPEDLYIPPEALEVFLEKFEGPLDLLLYLIRKHNVDILDIPVAPITQQYMDYITLMKAFKLELAADYLVMAAMLAEIKSRLLLPKPPEILVAEEKDPRAELIRRLQIYEQMKKAAEDLSQLPQLDKDIFWVTTSHDHEAIPQALPQMDLSMLIKAMRGVLSRVDLKKHHEIRLETISVRERMSDILAKLQHHTKITFDACFSYQEGRIGIVASFVAILELLKEGCIQIEQPDPLGPLLLKRTDTSASLD